MFGIGAVEVWLCVVTVMVLALVWRGWRNRWVSVSRTWDTTLDAADIAGVLGTTFASAPGARWRAQPDGTWIFTLRRVPMWAVVLGVITLPIGLVLLLVKESADLHVRIVNRPDGCGVGVVGRTSGTTVAALDTWLSRLPRVERV